MKAKLFINILFSFCIITSILTSCKEDNPWPEESEITTGSYISGNPTDPEFLKIVTKDGSVINVLGERDQNGLPDLVRQINIQTTHETNSFLFDNQGQLSTVISDNGTVFNYSVLEDGNYAIKIVCNDNQTELNLKIYINGFEVDSSISFNSFAHRDYVCNEIGFQPIDNSPSNSVSSDTYLLHVTNCYATNDVDIPYRVLLYNSDGSELFKEVTAQKTSSGIYEIVIPTANVSAVNEANLVYMLNSVMETYCENESLYLITSEEACNQINEQIEGLGITADVANGIGTACSGIREAFDLYCSLVCSTSVGSSAIDLIANQKMIENFTYSDKSLLLKVFFNTVPKTEMSFILADNISSDLYAELNSNSTPEIKDICTNPLYPEANEDYTVNILAYCMPIGSTLSIIITGDDGYYDVASLEITDENQTSGWYNYVITGRTGRTNDEIEVKISSGWTEDVTRYLTMAFDPEDTELPYQYKNFSLELNSATCALGIESLDKCPFTGNTINFLEWENGQFTNKYYYKQGSQYIDVELTGQIITGSDGIKLLTGSYSSKCGIGPSDLYQQITQNVVITRLPAFVYNDNKAVFLIDESTPKLLNSIENYISYQSALKFEGETSMCDSFGVSPYFSEINSHFIFTLKK